MSDPIGEQARAGSEDTAEVSCFFLGCGETTWTWRSAVGSPHLCERHRKTHRIAVARGVGPGFEVVPLEPPRPPEPEDPPPSLDELGPLEREVWASTFLTFLEVDAANEQEAADQAARSADAVVEAFRAWRVRTKR